MTIHLTRREFLRLSGVAAAAAMLPAWPEPTEHARPAPWRPQSGGPARMGRAIHTVTLYDAPRADAGQLGVRYREESFPIQRELHAPGLNTYNDLWYETPDGYVFSAWVQPLWVWPPQIAQTEIGPWGFWGEICVPFTDAREFPDAQATSPYRFYNGTVYRVVDVAFDPAGNAWYKIHDELPPPSHQWVLARDIRRIPRSELAPIHPFAGAKRIVADLRQNRLTCFEGDAIVYTTLCSPGIGNREAEDGTIEDLNTPPGEHCVILKQASRHMSNIPREDEQAEGEDGEEKPPPPSDPFDLPGVPWNTFFDRGGVAIHGAYWHNDFGIPRSHGCLNVSTDAARWIYRWTYPIGGAEDDYVQSNCQVGTPITVIAANSAE